MAMTSSESLFFGMLGLVGLFVCLFGYRLFRSALTLMGGVAGALYGAWIMQAYYGPEAWGVIALGAVIMGVLGLGLALWVYFLSILAAGALLGFLVAGMFADIVPSEYAFWLMIGCGCLGALVTMGMQRWFIILVTSLVGGWHVAAGVEWYRTGSDLLPYVHPFHDPALQWHEALSPVALGVVIASFFGGLIIQRLITAPSTPFRR